MRTARGGNLRAIPVAPGTEPESDGSVSDLNQIDAQNVNSGIDDLQNLPEAPKAMPIAPHGDSQAQVHDDVDLDSLPSAGGQLGQVYGQVAPVQPDHAAKVLDLAAKTGQHPAFVDANLKDAEQAVQKPDANFFQSIEDKFPGTTKFLKVPQNMAVAHDDIPNLAKHEQLVHGITQAMDIAGSLKAGFQASALGLSSRGKLPDTELPPNAPILNRLAAQAAGLAGDFPAMVPGGAVGAEAGGTAGVIAGSPLGLPGAALGGAIGAVVGGGIGAFAAPAAIKEHLRQKYEKGDLKGVADALERAGNDLSAATKQGLVGGLTSVVGLGLAAPFENAAAKAFLPSVFENAALKTAVPLIGENIAMTKAGNAIEGKETKPEDYLDTALMIGAMHGVGHLTETGINHYIEAKKTAQAVQFYNGIGETGGASKLLQRLPPQYASMLGDLTKDSPVENIHIPQEAFNQYFQSKNIDPAQAASELGVSDAYAEAQKTGGNVTIPTQEFVRNVVKTEHYQGLKDDIKFDPEGFTVNEIKSHQADIQEQLKQTEAAALANEGSQSPEESALKIYDERYQQLIEAGRSESEAKMGATLHSQAFKTLAERTGQDPYELAKRFQLEVQKREGIETENPDDLNFSQEELKSFEQSGLEIKREGNVLDASSLFGKKEEPSDGKLSGKVIVRDGEHFVRDSEGRKFHIEKDGERLLGKDVRFNVNENDSAIEIDHKGEEPRAKIDSFSARFGDDEKIQSAIKKAQNPKKGPYVSNKAIKGTGWAPNFEAEPTGTIGKEGISQPHPKKGEPDPLQWADNKYGVTKDLIEKHNEADMPLTINTSSDLIGHVDYIEAMPKDTTVNMYMLGKNSEMNRALFPGNASRLRQEEAIERLREAGVKVNAIEPSTDDIIKVAGGEKEVAKKLGIDPSEVNSEIQKTLGLRLVKTLNQGEISPRGRIAFQRDKAVIDLFKDANRSTFLHESGHYFLEVMQHMTSEESAPQSLKDDMQAIRYWMGLKEGEAIGTPEHEKFARGFEAYLMEGKAPSEALRSAFMKFKQWLTQIYKSVRGLNVELSPQIREVMDRMLATDEEISRAQETMGFAQKGLEVPASVKPRMDSLASQAREQAESTLMKQQMEETTTQHKEFLKSERARLTEEAKKQVGDMPVYKAIEDIKNAVGTRKNIEGMASKLLDGKLKDEDAVHFETAAEVYDFADGRELALNIINSKANDHFNEAVKEIVDQGMAQHADMMNTGKLRAAALKAMHNEKMTELLALERNILSERVDKAEISGEVSKRNRIEARLAAQAAKDQAKQILDAKPIKDAGNARIYITAERNAAAKAAAAATRGDFERASEFKRQQMLNHALAAEAMRNREASDRATSYLSDAANRKNDLKDMPYAFNRQVDQLLEKFGFKEKSPEDLNTLRQTSKNMQDKGEDPLDIANATGQVIDPQTGQWKSESLQDFINRVNDNYVGLQLPDSVLSGQGFDDFKDMKMSDLRDLQNAVKMVTDAGKKYDRFLNDFIKADMKEAAAAFKKSVSELIGSPYAENRKLGAKYDSEWKQRFENLKNLPDSMIPTLVNTLTLCHYLDGGEQGPAHEYIYRPMKQAEDRKFARYAKMREDLTGENGLLGSFYTQKELADYKKEATKYDGRSITKENILSMALNWGNEANRDRIRAGFGSRDSNGRLIPLSDNAIEGLFKHLGKKDWDFAQATWKYLDTYWPEISALEMKMRGVEPGRVEASAFTNEHGTYEGGYYPISYDFEKASEAFKNEQAKNELYKQYSASSAQTESGHTAARTSFVARPVRLSMDVLFNHLENVIHDLEFRPAVVDTSKFLAMPDVKTTLESAIGMKAKLGLDDWLKSSASDQSENLTYYEKAFSWSRYATTISALGFKPAMLLLHFPTNIIHGIWEIGVKNMTGSMTRSMLDVAMGRGNLKDFVHDKSERMKQRGTIRDRDIMDMSKAWQGTAGGEIPHYAFMMLHLADEAVSLPLWKEVYQKNVEELGHSKAVDTADEAVTRTLGSGSKVDRAGWARGTAAQKLFTTFYGWESVVFNRAWLDGKISGLEYKQGNTGTAIGIMAKATFFAFMLPAIHRALLTEALRNGPTTDDERKKHIADAFLEEPFAKIPFVRDIAQTTFHYALNIHGAEYKMSPVEMAWDNILKPVGHTAQIAWPWSDKHMDQKYGEELARGLSVAAGYPQQLNTWAFNYLDYMQNNGEASMKDFLSRRKKK